METKILEINLISAQGLKPPSAKLRRMQTYAVVWTDPATKLRTQIDSVGSDNPTWNDKFLFKVNPDFLSRETSGVSIEIYAVSYLRDSLIGTVRFLISNLPLTSHALEIVTPAFFALQVRRPSGRFHGVLNIAANVSDGADFPALKGVSAIGYRDLMGESVGGGPRRKRDSKMGVSLSSLGEDSDDLSDGTDSTTSSSSTQSTVLRDWNTVRGMTGKGLVRSSSDGVGLFCGLVMKGKLPQCLSAQNLQFCGGSQKEN